MVEVGAQYPYNFLIRPTRQIIQHAGAQRQVRPLLGLALKARKMAVFTVLHFCGFGLFRALVPIWYELILERHESIKGSTLYRAKLLSYMVVVG